MLIRPLPSGLVNSESAMPIRRMRHSRLSALPRVIAILGRCPSDWFLGRRNVSVPEKTLSWQALTIGSVTWRRHFPVWMTTGMFVPTGTFCIVKFPAASDSALATGWPDAMVPHLSQVTPSTIGSSAAFGT